MKYPLFLCRISTKPFERYSERLTDGSDDDRNVAYARWRKRLRLNQFDGEREDASPDQVGKD